MSRTALQMRKASGDGPVEVMQRLVLDEAPGKIQGRCLPCSSHHDMDRILVSFNNKQINSS